jgi:hypothetical protein
MTTYNVWVGGSNSWGRSYTGEVGYITLTPAQAERWLKEDEDGDIDFEAMAERLHRSWDEEQDGEDDFPTRDEVENGCLGSGAYTDQTFGVSKVLEDGEEEIIWSGDYGDLAHVDDQDDEDICPRKLVRCEEPYCRWEGDNVIYEPGVAYHHVFKGGWGAEIELPDEEEFDVRKLQFDILEVDGLAEIVTHFSYNGEDYYDDNCTDGKSFDWYAVIDGEYTSL